MRQNAKETENNSDYSLRQKLEVVLDGLKFKLIELTVSRHKGSVQIKAVIYCGVSISTDDCSKVHRSILPRLELAFPQQNIYLEVSSPGIDRLIKDKSEFTYYMGRGIRCYRTDISDWTAGVLESTGDEWIILKTKDAVVKLEFNVIAKAKLDPAQEV
jgi:ribosome maturation factor RimP